MKHVILEVKLTKHDGKDVIVFHELGEPDKIWLAPTLDRFDLVSITDFGDRRLAFFQLERGKATTHVNAYYSNPPSEPVVADAGAAQRMNVHMASR